MSSEKGQAENMNESLQPDKATTSQQISDVINKDEQQVVEKCPICLQKLLVKSKSYAPNCFHAFCFECLLEWTKVKYSCPLCKREMDRIVYDVQSRLQFKEYHLAPLEINPTTAAVDVIAYVPPHSPHEPVNVFKMQNGQIAHGNQISKASWLLNRESAPNEFRILVYKHNWYVNSNQIQIDYEIQNLDLEFGDHLVENASNLASESTLKCTSYKAVSKLRNIEPEWFRANPACTHRLNAFIYRELNALSHITTNDRLHLSSRLQLSSQLIHLMKKIHMESEKFFEEISYFIKPIRYARHFIHELVAFAKSTSNDLIDYDAKCVYYSNWQAIPLATSRKNEADLIPLRSLPVILDKYRLHSRSLSDVIEIADSAVPTTSRMANRSVTDNDELVDTESNSSDSEHSSFCEELEVPAKPDPILIVLSSSENEDECYSVRSTSTRRSENRASSKSSSSCDSAKRKPKSKHKHKKKRKHKEDERHSKKKNKKEKKAKKKHGERKKKSRSRHSSSSSSSSSSTPFATTPTELHTVSNGSVQPETLVTDSNVDPSVSQIQTNSIFINGAVDKS